MKFRLLLLLLFFFVLNPIFAQFYEDFTDGDLSNGISWSGNTSEYKVNTSKQLQLDASGAGSSYLSASLAEGGIVEWNCWVKFSLSPSDNNQAIIYLVSDNADLSLPLNGYYLKLGETGSGDAIRLFKQEQSEHILVASGTDGFINEAFEIRIKVTRDDGTWTIYADSTGGYSWQLQGSGVDEYWQAYGYLGILCRYTASNSTKFKFDDIYAGPLVMDTQAPLLVNAKISDPSSVELLFNEPLNAESVSVCSNYLVDNDFGSPIAAGVSTGNPSIVRLQFLDIFTEGKEYKLLVRHLTDVAGNILLDTEVSISLNPVHQFDILVSEIMADPSPALGLPECEYVELYNRTDHVVQLDGFYFFTGDEVKELPAFSIPGNGYHLITGTGCDTLMSSFGHATALTGFSLLNTGESVGLLDNNMTLIHQVTYDPAWIDNKYKEEGGWSIEMVDPLNPCGDLENWEVSDDPSGGTPGRKNSVHRINPDNSPPHIEWISVPDSFTVKVVFSEIMDSVFIKNPLNYFADGGLGYPADVKLTTPVYNSAELTFTKPIARDVIYRLTLTDNVSDCAGNTLNTAKEISFALPYQPDTNDLVINEILYEPNTSRPEFVEIYNRSDKVLTLKNLIFGLMDDYSGEISSSCKVSDEHRIIFPGEYIVLTSEPLKVMSEYFAPSDAVFFKCKDFPSLPNNGGTIVISTLGLKNIDRVTYGEDLHFALLNSTKGVSLERVNYNASSNEPANWHSASATCGYATPGYCNSQFMHTNAGGAAITIEPKSISPDNDGFEDQMSFSFRFTKPGTLVTVQIYDSNGREVKTIASSHMAGESASFLWDGTDNNRRRIQSGIYAAFIQFVNTDGTVNSSKHAVVVTGR